MIRKKNLVAVTLMTALLSVFVGGSSMAQQPTEIWRSAPSNSLVIAGFDGRPSNPSVQAIAGATTPEAIALQAQQEIAMQKAIESFATLFGISLDFAKDVESWAGQQWAFVLLPEGKRNVQPVFIVESTNPAAANTAMQKLLAPWQRVGNVTAEPDTDFAINSFTTGDKSMQVYVSAAGSMLALSPSKTSLKAALAGTGFAAGSAGERALNSLSGSLFYAYVDQSLLKQMKVRNVDVPLSGAGMGMSMTNAGAKIRMLGFINPEASAFLKQVAPAPQITALTTNSGIPATSLVAASLPSISGVSAMTAMFATAQNPLVAVAQALGDTQISLALTAALPVPAGGISIATPSEQAAAEKLIVITNALKKRAILKQNLPIAGMTATQVVIPQGPPMYLVQVGSNIVMASDAQSLLSVSASLKGQQPSLADSLTYKETMANLQGSNILTAYVNLAPIQGIGYLAEGIGLGQLEPIYGTLATGLQDIQAAGLGVGLDGDVASVSMFLRAKPGLVTNLAPAFPAGMAIGAAVLFPVFARARNMAEASECSSITKQLAAATINYTYDNNGLLPARTNWREKIAEYSSISPEEMVCEDGEAIIAFNKNLGGLNIDKIENPWEVVMFFEASPSLPNASGSRADMILPHEGKGLVGYADGHVKLVSSIPPQSQWVPKYTQPKPVKKAPVKKAPVRKSTVKSKSRR